MNRPAMLRLPVLALAAAVIALGACGNDEEEEPAPATDLEATARHNDLELVLRVEHPRYEPGQDVRFELLARTVGESGLTLVFATAQRFDLVVTREGERGPVWRWSDGKAFAQVLGEEELLPSRVLGYSQAWEQTDSDGEQVPPGTYNVVAWITGCLEDDEGCGGYPVGQLSFEIQP
jgi:hypothetical protein